MNSTLFDLILRQSYLHLISYGLVLCVLLVALTDGFLIRHLKRALRSETDRLRTNGWDEETLSSMVHPVGRALRKRQDLGLRPSARGLERDLELADAALFVPLRARMSLTRDLSTLMGLIATLLALVAAASDFARHGQPELLIGSVGTGCVATCVAAIGCAIALWNLSRLTRLRVQVACESEEVLRAVCEADEPESTNDVPILHRDPAPIRPFNNQPETNHASL